LSLDPESSYRYLGSGSDLALEVSGPTVAECLARAVEGVASLFADVHPSIVGVGRRVELDGCSPSAQLRALLDEVHRCARDGHIVIALQPDGQPEVEGRLAVTLELVAWARARETSPVPDAIDWHDVRLEPDGDGWVGRIVAPL
jgi:SHS2 domain-containing protein